MFDASRWYVDAVVINPTTTEVIHMSTTVELDNAVEAAETLRRSWHKSVEAVKTANPRLDNTWNLGRITGIAYALGLLLGKNSVEMQALLVDEHDEYMATVTLG